MMGQYLGVVARLLDRTRLRGPGDRAAAAAVDDGSILCLHPGPQVRLQREEGASRRTEQVRQKSQQGMF